MPPRRKFLEKSTQLAAGAPAAGAVAISSREAQAQQPQATAKKLNILMRSSWGTRLLALPVVVLIIAGCGGGGSAPPPMLSLSQSSLAFNAPFGGTNPPAAAVNVTITGATSNSFTAASDSPWLSVTPGTGTTPQTIQISVALGNLTTASYPGHITVTAPGVQGSPAMIAVTFAVGAPPPSSSPFWAQWGANPQHAGMVNAAGQNLVNKLDDIVYDPFVPQEQTEAMGNLVVHYQAPIVDGNDSYITMKSGTYTSCPSPGDWRHGAACGPNAWNTMVWNAARYTWENGNLVKIWSFMSDWKPEPNDANFQAGFGGLYGWEPVFHPVDANTFIYVPGAVGAVWKVDKATGISVSRINPFNGVSGVTADNTFVSGPLTADANGNIYYNVIELNINGNPWSQNDVMNAWLVKIAPNDAATTVTYATLIPTAPLGNSNNCPGTFFNLNDGGASLPWPPSPTAVPPTQPCGSQRPGVNVAPAVAADGTGTIYTASFAHFDGMVVYLVAVNPDLTPKWAASLQNRLTDGCGVLLPIAPPSNTTTPNSCRNGTTPGVDPTTNSKGSANVADAASSSPTVLPDGSVLYAATDNYNYGRGHLFHFDKLGNYLNAYTFGWDSTPGVYAHNGTYSIVVKDNHYPVGAYCNPNFSTSPVCTALPAGPYYISQLDANLNVEWSFQSTTIDVQHPNGYEWCINMPAIDMNGTVYVNSEDGNIYAIPQGHSGVFTTPQSHLFLNLAIGAAYTPLSIGPDGKLYTQNDGHLFVVGN